MATVKIQPSEHDIQDTIIQYLQLKKFYVQRMNSGRTTIDYMKKVKYGNQTMNVPTQRNIWMGVAGTPDLLAFRSVFVPVSAFGQQMRQVQLLFIEVKRPGNKPTPIQKAKMQELEEYGAMCIVATSVEDLKSYIG